MQKPCRRAFRLGIHRASARGTQWGHRGGCDPWNPLRLRDENDEAKVPKVDHLQPFRRQVKHFLTDMSNRVEHQKLNQVTAELPPG